MTQNFFIILFLVILVGSMVAMLLHDIFAPARALSKGVSALDDLQAQAAIEDSPPLRALTSCDITKANDIRDVDFGK